MPAKWIPPHTDDWIENYLAGESLTELARKLNISRNALTAALRTRGVEIRDIGTANRLEHARRTPEQRSAYASAAHAAARGRTHSLDEKIRRAITRERKHLGTSPTEMLLAEWLWKRGIETIAQKAIGPYNTDLASGTVAVEVFGGNWHSHGRHRARTAERYRYILDQGWCVIIIWVNQRRYPLGLGAADYLARLIKQSRSDPTLRGQYRVIWGDGKVATVSGDDLDQLAVPPTRGRTNNSKR